VGEKGDEKRREGGEGGEGRRHGRGGDGEVVGWNTTQGGKRR
jgi:hypothetical protein